MSQKNINRDLDISFRDSIKINRGAYYIYLLSYDYNLESNIKNIFISFCNGFRLIARVSPSNPQLTIKDQAKR